MANKRYPVPNWKSYLERLPSQSAKDVFTYVNQELEKPGTKSIARIVQDLGVTQSRWYWLLRHLNLSPKITRRDSSEKIPELKIYPSPDKQSDIVGGKSIRDEKIRTLLEIVIDMLDERPGLSD
jgi:hypothetical protein